MTKFLQRLPVIGARFRKADDGTATVEAVLWFPIFILVFGLMVDASMIFHGQSKVLRVVQDANRNMSIGRLDTNAEVESYINAQLALFGVVPKSTTAISDGNFVYTVVTVPARQLQALGYFNSLLNLEIDVSSAHVLDSVDPSAFATTVATTL